MPLLVLNTSAIFDIVGQ